jgi:hypothetical protein
VVLELCNTLISEACRTSQTSNGAQDAAGARCEPLPPERVIQIKLLKQKSRRASRPRMTRHVHQFTQRALFNHGINNNSTTHRAVTRRRTPPAACRCCCCSPAPSSGWAARGSCSKQLPTPRDPTHTQPQPQQHGGLCRATRVDAHSARHPHRHGGAAAPWLARCVCLLACCAAAGGWWLIGQSAVCRSITRAGQGRAAQAPADTRARLSTRRAAIHALQPTTRTRRVCVRVCVCMQSVSARACVCVCRAGARQDIQSSRKRVAVVRPGSLQPKP